MVSGIGAIGGGINNGFVMSKLQGITISSDDMQKYGIKPEDWQKVDKDGDYLITAAEFMANGMNIASIFNAYKTLATASGAYVTPAQQAQMQANPQNNMFASNNQRQQDPNKTYSLTHPNITSPTLGNTHDFLA